MVAMAQSSAEGNISVLDARLRPDGEKGPLISPLDGYETYYRQRAQLWEIQALTRARPITGPLQQPYIDMVQETWRETGQQSDLFDKIGDMLTRIRLDRGSGSDFLDFKTGEGGIIEAEFLVQALQMRTGTWNPNWSDALNALRNGNVISTDEAKIAKHNYEFLRRCETVLRRWDIKNVSTLPADSGEQEKLARRLGCENVDAFAKEYVDARKAIHRLYEKHTKIATR
jgi:Glutamine synthetase adenylyltransferase